MILPFAIIPRHITSRLVHTSLSSTGAAPQLIPVSTFRAGIRNIIVELSNRRERERSENERIHRRSEFRSLGEGSSARHLRFKQSDLRNGHRNVKPPVDVDVACPATRQGGDRRFAYLRDRSRPVINLPRFFPLQSSRLQRRIMPASDRQSHFTRGKPKDDSPHLETRTEKKNRERKSVAKPS